MPIYCDSHIGMAPGSSTFQIIRSVNVKRDKRYLLIQSMTGDLFIPTPKEYICNPQTLGPHLKFLWAPTVTIDSLLCGLVIRQALEAHGISAKDILARPRSRTCLITILARDSVMYFIVYV